MEDFLHNNSFNVDKNSEFYMSNIGRVIFFNDLENL